jgi:hypothetical protein
VCGANVLALTVYAVAMAAALHSPGVVLHNGDGPTTISRAGWSLDAPIAHDNVDAEPTRRAVRLLAAAGLSARFASDDTGARNRGGVLTTDIERRYEDDSVAQADGELCHQSAHGDS